MTVASATAKVGPYAGNGSQTVFPYTFKVFDQAELQVVLTSAGGIETVQTLTTHYAVSGVGQDAGGNVTMVTAPPAGSTLTIVRDVAFVQNTDLRNQGGFYPEVHERVFDRLTMQTQQLKRSADSSLRLPVSAPANISTVLPVPEADKFIGWNSNASGLQNLDSSGLATIVAYGTGRADLFSGNGAQTQFSLSNNPGNQAVLDVSISGVTQRPGIDYTWTGGTTLTFVAAPPAGTNNILARYFQGLPGIITDANDVLYSQGGAGSSVRSVQSKLRDAVSVKDFGAVGDGVTDDAVAFQAAFNAAIALGKSLHIPAGSYRLSSKISGTSTSTAFRLHGEGRGLSKLIWTASATNGGGIDLTYTDTLFPPEVKDLSLYTQAVGNGTALKITGPDEASVTQLGPIVDSLQVQGEQPVTHTWDVGIHFVTCWYLKGESLNIKGKGESGSNYTMTAGIRLTSCQVSYLSDFNIIHADFGVQETASGGPQKGEGFTIKNFEMVGVGTGIDLTADAVAPGTNIGPGHINSHFYGLNLANQYQTKIHDLLLYKVNIGGPTDWVGIQMVNCMTNHVHNNLFHGWDYAINSTIGIILTGSTTSDFNQIHHNTFYNFFGATKIGVLLGTGAGNNVLDHNVCTDGTVLEPVRVNSDAEKNNYFFRNLPMPIQTFAANVATPSVGNDLSGQWNTANSSPTTITNFLDGYTSQVISVLVNDTNTTFQHNANLIMKSGANYAAPNGTILLFRRDATLWREMSRSA